MFASVTTPATRSSVAGEAIMKKKFLLGVSLGVLSAVLIASPAGAQDADATQIVLDNIWVFTAGAMVFFMQAGFALVEAGLTRAKSVSNIMAKNLADALIGGVAFFIVGYSIAFASSGTWWGGLGDFFLKTTAGAGVLNSPGGLTDNLTPAVSFFFQVVFAATAVTIASGAMAERTKFSAYLIFSAVMTAIIYPVVVHWTWGGGLVSRISIGNAVYSDFAGSTVVHMTGGIAALMGAAFLGPRIGRYAKHGSGGHPIPGHSIPMAILGVFILWFGWFGFNPGSELAADLVVPMLALNTFIAACAGGVVATAVIWWKSGVPDVAMMGNGVLAGLVAVTAPVGTAEPWGAMVIGAVGGVIVVFSVLFFDRIRIDDPVGAVSVHAVCGLWGTLSVGLFARYNDGFLGRENAGLLYGGGLSQLLVQLLFVLVIAAWVGAASAGVFFVLKKTIGLRVDPDEEMQGLDVIEHGGSGYGPDPVPAG